MRNITLILSSLVLALTSPELRAGGPANPVEAADSLHRATMARASPATRAFIKDQAGKLPPGPYADDNRRWTAFVADMAERGGAIDPNALVQLVLRESYLQTSEDVRLFAEKVQYFNTAKKLVRDYLTSLRDFDQQMNAKNANDSCEAAFCVRSANDLATISTALRNAGVAQVIASRLTKVNDVRQLVEQLDAASKRLESDAASNDEAAKAARNHRDHLLNAMRDYLAKVSQIKGTF